MRGLVVCRPFLVFSVPVKHEADTIISWDTEWQDDRPPGPSYLRILYLGKILQDEDTLSSRPVIWVPGHVLTPSPHRTLLPDTCPFALATSGP
jgi:hypothetical protein